MCFALVSKNSEHMIHPEIVSEVVDKLLSALSPKMYPPTKSWTDQISFLSLFASVMLGKDVFHIEHSLRLSD